MRRRSPEAKKAICVDNIELGAGLSIVRVEAHHVRKTTTAPLHKRKARREHGVTIRRPHVRSAA
jgi:hypothetical protein